MNKIRSFVTATALSCCGAIGAGHAQIAAVATTPDANARNAKQTAALEARVVQLELTVQVLQQRIKKVEDASDPPESDKDSKGGGGKGESAGNGKAGGTGPDSSGGGNLKDVHPVMTVRAPFVVVDAAGQPILRVQGPGSKGASIGGDRGLVVYGDSGLANFALATVASGGRLAIQDNSGNHMTTVAAVSDEAAIKVRNAGKVRAYMGYGDSGKPRVYLNDASGNVASALAVTGDDKGIVAVFHANNPVAFLTESTHAGGGNVTTTNPAGEGVFSAGYDGDEGSACVDHKRALHCLGIGLPLSGQ
jgi:hypothetical protein